MGRLRRHRKIKSFDPFNPKKPSALSAQLPPEPSGPILDETGLPKKLQRIVRRQEYTAKLEAAKRQSGARGARSAGSNGEPATGKGQTKGTKHKQPYVVPERLPGESFRDYQSRVAETISLETQEQLKAARRVSDRRRTFLAERKKRKRVKQSDKQGEPAISDQARDLAPVRFGEVAKDIPHFSALPKGAARGGIKATKPTEDQEGAPSKSAADKRILEAERQRVIVQYRQLKLAKMLRSGSNTLAPVRGVTYPHIGE